MGVDGFPAIIDGDEDGSVGNAFLALFPSDEILQADDVEIVVFELFHLLSELRNRQEHVVFRGG